MKKMKSLYDAVISRENLYRSAYLAAKGRRYTDSAADFIFNLEEEIDCLHKELMIEKYRHGAYRLFTIYEPKERKIAAAPFKDRVVHHAVHDVIEPIIDKTFIYDSYACRKGKGTHKAVARAQKFFRANKFCFHGDIKKYFHSIDHGVLKEIIKKRFRSEKLLRLIGEIIDSADSAVIVCGEDGREGVGLPIGNLTSQFFANLYLNELDYFVKFGLRLKYYLRYMDDFLIFENDREKLSKIKAKIDIFLRSRLRLDLHEGKSRIFNVKRGVKFLGFRIFDDYMRLSSDNVRRFRKRLKNFIRLFEDGKLAPGAIRDSLRSWTAHAGYANTSRLRGKIMDDIVSRNRDFGTIIGGILVE